MNGNERRQQIISLIDKSDHPISGAALASHFSISRQVVVQDIAILRTAGHDIIATNRGYILNVSKCRTPAKVVKVSHTDEQIEDELCTIIDLGGTVLDVFVSHKTYGLIRADMNIRSRRDIRLFIENIKSGKSMPLKNITSNYHYHTITADDTETLELIYNELADKGYLVRIDDWDRDNIL